MVYKWRIPKIKNKNALKFLDFLCLCGIICLSNQNNTGDIMEKIMKAYDKQISVFEKYNLIQAPMYNDTSDHGILLDDVKDPKCLEVAEAIKELIEMGFNTNRTLTNTKRGEYVTHTINIPWDMNDEGTYFCKKWSIYYINDRIKHIKFMAFYVENNDGIELKDIYKINDVD